MEHTSTWQRLLPTTLPGVLLVVATVCATAMVPSAHAAGRSAATPVTTTSISYRLDADIIHGAKAGAVLVGWLGGSLDSTGVLTATLTSGMLPPLMANCAPHVDFGPACALPASANVSGRTIGSGASAIATFTAKGKGWTWVLTGAAVGTSGEWAGTISQGSVYVGTWSLTPQPITVHIDLGGQSDAKSKDKVVLGASINLNVTADGRAIGTFSPINNALPTVVQGYANPNNGSIMVAIPMGRLGSVLVTGWSRPGFGGLNWKGSFVGPAIGDYGTWAGQG